MDVNDFLVLYPEFSVVDSEQIAANLAEVALGLDPGVYGNLLDAAQGALTAHQLFISPSGLSLRADTTDTGTSDYKKKYDRIFKQVSFGFAVVR